MFNFLTSFTYHEICLKDALEAVWNEIEALTKKNLTVQLGQLAEYVDQGRKDLRHSQLGVIQQNLSPHGHTITAAVSGFLTILRKGPIETLREMEARAEQMWNERDHHMAESDSDDGDTLMGEASDAIFHSSGSDSDNSRRSANSVMSIQSNASNITMEDAQPLTNHEQNSVE